MRIFLKNEKLHFQNTLNSTTFSLSCILNTQKVFPLPTKSFLRLLKTGWGGNIEINVLNRTLKSSSGIEHFAEQLYCVLCCLHVMLFVEQEDFQVSSREGEFVDLESGGQGPNRREGILEFLFCT